MPAEATVERYRDAALILLPPGRAISKDAFSTFADLFAGCSVEWARIHEDAATMVANIVPGSSPDYLDLWEATFQLPSPCVRNPPTDAASRMATVQLHLLGLYEHSITAYQRAAAELGYPGALTVLRYQPALCTGECTQPIYGDGWANVITILVTGPQSDTLTCIFVDQLRRAHAYIAVEFL